MKAYRLLDTAGQPTFQLRDLARPEPGPDQLLVRVRAASLNRGEFLGGHGPQGGGEARPVGGEAAGEVVACGANVSGWQVGDRVMGRCNGAFAEFGLMDRREAMAVPAALSWAQAAAVPLTFIVVYDMLVTQGELKTGETLLVAGVTSGVGVAALKAAKAMGASVIGTSGSEAKLARLKAEDGLDLGLCTRSPDFHAAVREATGGRGANLAINTVGGTVFAECMRALAFQGRLAMVGYVDGVLHTELDLELLHRERLRLFGVSNKKRTVDQRAQSVAGFRSDWLPLFADGRLTPLVDQVFPFAQLAEAHAAMEAGRHVGKIVLMGLEDGLGS